MSAILFLHFLLPLQAQERKSNDMFRYAIGASSIDTSLFNNLSSARKLKNFFDSLNASPDASIRRVEIFSSASMEGDVTSNRKLNMLRNETVKSVLKKMSDIPDSLIQCVDGGVAWEELRNAVDTSGMQYKEEVLYILDNEPEETWEHGVLVDSRNKHLMDLRGGRPYNYMRKTFFPAFRYTRISIVYSGNVKNYGKYEKDVLEDAVADEGTEKEAALMVEITRDSSEAKTGMERVISDTLPQTPKDTVIYVPETVPEKTAGSSVENVHDRQPSVKKDSPMFAVKTNVLLLGAGVANAGVEARITDRFSFDFPVIYSPYTIKNNYRLRALGFQPEFRYWFGSFSKGHFVGLNGNFAWFNVALSNDNRYQDTENRPLMGAGISYGYSWKLLPSLSLEFTVGAGYANIHYDVFYNVKDGICYDSGVKGYWGITKAGISVVYTFNFRK